ncbi:branched chain amino acid aminotransferase [Allostella vacuolata]|nr:branched chain amino acid aminotransferase [Stella vacuolata]
MPDGVRRIAMWSGPRNLSTALLRAWENRPDAWVVDEPLYAHYLDRTGKDHPGRAAVIASQPTDWRPVADRLTGECRPGLSVFYQKHMAHHLLPGIERGWIDALDNCFLIRDPRAVIASYVRSREAVALDDLGYAVQAELFDRECRRTGRTPAVVDAADLLADPAGALGALCRALEVPWDPAMLSWPVGPRDSDGVWAPHWYASVWRSTGWGPPRPDAVDLPEALLPLAAAAEPYYRHLHRHRLCQNG